MIPLTQDLAATTLELCAIPSPTGSEAELAALVERRCLDRVGPGRVRRLGNAVIADGARQAGRPHVTLFGHLDTVPPAAEQELGIVGERLFGCGASDMKGGLAVMLALLGESAPKAVDLRCVFYDREEGPATENGLEPLLAAGLLGDTDLGICLEPTDNRIEAGCMGSLHAKIHFLGRRGHSARPWQGDNAIYRAIDFLARLRDLPRREVAHGELRFYEVTSATTAATANSRNVIPDRFTLNVNARFAPGRTLAEAEAELRTLIPAAAPVEVEIVDRSPSGSVHLEQPLVAAWRGRRRLAVAAKQAWTDVARLDQYGIPAVSFGPGETSQAHQAHESIPIDHLVAAYLALRDLLALDGGGEGA